MVMAQQLFRLKGGLMAQFIFVANGITIAQFEKAIGIQVEANGKVSFVPQANSQNNVNTNSMTSGKLKSDAPETLQIVRFEWADSGSDFGAEIVKILAKG